ncbi:MAG: PhzF family phenazine biosynthesis protein [Solirubrobacteraceae bacterium]
MSRPHRFALLDVFTDRPLTGNGLAVVHDADGIDDEAMLGFAREMRLSETTFVQSADRDGADYRNRIWDLRRELPFAGHPSLGTAVAVARARGEREARYVQQTPAGLQPVDVRLDGESAYASMLQEAAEFGPLLEPREALAPVGLGVDAAVAELPPQVVSTGVPQVLVPVRGPTALSAARPDWRAAAALLDRHGAIVLYLAACDPAAGRARARAFTHSAEMGEDPATGSAAGPLCAYLHARAGAERLEIDQGLEMGRPSRLECAMESGRVRVGGGVVVLGEGSVFL